jgi:hypothetical protein
MKKSDFEKSSWKNKQKFEKKCDSDGVASVAWAFHFAQPFYALRAGHPPNGLTAAWGVARPQGWRPVAVFFPLDTPSRTGLHIPWDVQGIQ